MRTLIFAHRGYSSKFPENTLPAFQAAIECGSDGIELDVQLSKDKIPVIMHDETLKRMTGKRGFVKDYTLSELQTFKIVKRYGFRVVKTTIPTLDDVLQLLQQTKIILNIEFKNSVFAYKGIEEKVMERVHHFGMSGRVIYSSFNQASVAKVATLDKKAETAVLLSQFHSEPWLLASKLHAKGVHPSFRSITPDLIESCHRYGLNVRAYTVNQASWVQKLSKWKIDGIMTNNPVMALKQVKS